MDSGGPRGRAKLKHLLVDHHRVVTWSGEQGILGQAGISLIAVVLGKNVRETIRNETQGK